MIQLIILLGIISIIDFSTKKIPVRVLVRAMRPMQ